EHGGVHRESRTLPRSRVRRTRQRNSGPDEAPGLADEGGPARGARGRGPAPHSHAEEDGLSGARRPVAPWALLARRRGVRARPPGARPGAVRAVRAAPTRRAASLGGGRSRRPAVASRESGGLATDLPRRRRRAERDAGG